MELKQVALERQQEEREQQMRQQLQDAVNRIPKINNDAAAPTLVQSNLGAPPSLTAVQPEEPQVKREERDEVTEIGLLRKNLQEKVDEARELGIANKKAAELISKMEHDNKELVKQIDLLTMEKDQMYKVDLEMI